MIHNYMRQLGATFALLLLFLGAGRGAFAETFNLIREGGVFVLPVQINHSITLKFTIDSGASDVVIPQDVFSTLSRAGTITSKDMLASGTYELADGTHQESRRFRIRSLQIGGLELKDVTASVAPAGGSLLLGQSFLSHLPGWSIDNRRELLIVGNGNEKEDADSLSKLQQAQAELVEKTQKWIDCAKPFEAKARAALDLEKQLAIVYPRFGLLWNEHDSFTSHCNEVMRNKSLGNDVTDADAAQCDIDAMKRTNADFVNRVASIAEPNAVMGFNLAQTDARQALSEMERTCGKP